MYTSIIIGIMSLEFRLIQHFTMVFIHLFYHHSGNI